MNNPFKEDTTPRRAQSSGQQSFRTSPNQDFFSTPPQTAGDFNTQEGWGNPADWYNDTGWDTGQEADNAYLYDVPAKKRSWRWILIVLGLLFFLIVLAVSGGAGYFSGVQKRVEAEAANIQGSLQEQYDLALQDLSQGRYQVAKQRLEYILKNYPNFPNASQKLTEVQIALNLTMNVPNVTQTAPQFTPTPSPTPDIRGAEEVYRSAQTALNGKDWSGAIDLLLQMRKNYPDYNSVRVDGLLYLAYRNRGVNKILQEAQLEGGTYDLALAERYGPLDAEAQSYRDSFWELNWGEAVNYFGQLAPLAPQLRDASGWSAIQRYQIALGKYADQLINAKEYCQAEETYNLALQSGRGDIQPTAQAAHDLCSPPTQAPPAAEVPVPTQ
jgi:outer membrane protein assembly factor BamD (BamD/ComL family)